MPSATSEHTPHPQQQRATPNVTQQGPAPAIPVARALDPVLAEGIDPVLLHRLFPEADSIEDAAAAAISQGKKTAEAGAKLVAAQQEPVP